MIVRHRIVLFNVLTDEFVAGHIGLVPAHLLRSHSLQHAHAIVCRQCFWSMRFLKTNILQGSVVTLFRRRGEVNRFIANFLLSVTVTELSKSINIW